MILNEIISKDDLIFGRSLHALFTLIREIKNDQGSSVEVFLNPNICPEVIELFDTMTVPIICIDYDASHGYDFSHIENKISNTQGGVQILIHNCIYGDSHIPLKELAYLKRRFPDLIIILDACLLSIEKYILLKHENLFDLVIYSFGYSKSVDVNYGGIATVNNQKLLGYFYGLVSESYEKLAEKFCWNSYALDKRSNLRLHQPRAYKLDEDELLELNGKLQNKYLLSMKKKTIRRKKIRNLLRNYESYLLDIEQFDWRLNYLIPNSDVRESFEEILKNNKIWYSNHYINGMLQVVPRTLCFARNIFNVLDDEHQNRI